MSLEVRGCPRCGHVGSGVKHFQRPGHVVLLLGIAAVTWMTAGLGGLAYYFARRKRMICAQCGLGWQHTRIPAPGFADHPGLAGSSRTDLAGRGMGAEESLPPRGLKRRVLGVGILLFAALMIAIGVSSFELGLIVFGSVLGALGTTTLWWGVKAREDRRHAIMARLQRRVLLLATEKGGALTVTEVATSMGLSLSVAEEVLDRMDDGLRVRSEVTDEGIIVYEFPELRHHPGLESGSPG